MRFNREDWLSHGLRILSAYGPDELKIDRLCARLEVTKGSFYHHFPNRKAFVEALLSHWEAQNTDALISAAEAVNDTNERGLRLSEQARAADHAPEVALRAWARQEPVVAAFVKAVDTRRIDYLAKLIKVRGADARQAKVIAKLFYAHLVGVQQLGALVTAREWQQMGDLLETMLDATFGKAE